MRTSVTRAPSVAARWLWGALLVCAAQAGLAAEPIVERDVTYREVDGTALQLDIARPGDADGPRPLVVCIHGGGWHRGSRAFWRGPMTELARHGFVAATIDYRLAPEARWPAQIEDVKAAVRFLRAHAEQYGIDPKRVAAVGDSAGGQLSLVLGLSDDDQFEVGDYPEQSARVQAVVNYYGSMDMSTWKLTDAGERVLQAGFEGRGLDALIESFTGASDRADPRLATATPATYADAADPPVLTFHGTEDVLVPIEEARRFDAAARQAGVNHELVVIEGANHGWSGPAREQTNRQMLEFLERELR